ncbi:MAG: glycoside hydrolase family 9 protein [Calditrichia bacterium]
MGGIKARIFLNRISRHHWRVAQKNYRRLLIIPFLLLAAAEALQSEIYINQCGYLPLAPKQVWLSQPADSFIILSNGGSRVYNGALEPVFLNDPATGLALYRGDFSAFSQPGTFQIFAGADSSFSFSIGEMVYDSLFYKSLRGFYYQRCGTDLLGSHAGVYYHPRCHYLDATFHNSSGNSGFHPASGGWHDAGDYGKYAVNAGISAGTLLMAFEYLPQQFGADDLNIPESGNGIPDILDEVRYELAWLLKMQDSSGGIYHKLTREQFSPFIMPQNDNEARFIYQISSTATADFAAVAARAARIFQPFDSLFAQSCLAAARNAWNFLAANPAIVPPGGFSNPAGTQTGVYGDGDDRDERLWASSELFMTTGENSYHQYYISHYNQQGLFNGSWPMAWAGVRQMAHITYLFGKQPNASSNLRNLLRSSLQDYCEGRVLEGNGNGFGVSISPGQYVWGSNSVVLNNAVLLILGYLKMNQPDYLQAAQNQLHYVLGQNAHNMSFVTGAGSRFPMFPHHRPSAVDGISQPVPGLLAGGPNEYLQDPILAAAFSASTPPALCYLDEQESYASNEIAINWNAPLVFVAGYFAADPFVSSLERPEPPLPRKIELLPNYPNPFNGTTTLPFMLDRPQKIMFAVYNVRGECILNRDSGKWPAGRNAVIWDGRDGSGSPVASGIYYGQLRGRTNSEIRKMVYLK